MPDDSTLTSNRNFPPFAFGTTPDELNVSFENYRAVGQMIFDWATGARAWPANMADFRTQVGSNMHVPQEYQRLRIVQADNASVQSESGSNGLEFVLRLPPKGQVSESAQIVADNLQDYPLPRLYTLFLQPGHGRPALDVFHSRIADYTMRSCR
jgi:hypothetical protein